MWPETRNKEKIVLQISKNSVSFDAQRLEVVMSYQNQVKLQNAYASKEKEKERNSSHCWAPDHTKHDRVV